MLIFLKAEDKFSRKKKKKVVKNEKFVYEWILDQKVVCKKSWLIVHNFTAYEVNQATTTVTYWIKAL